MQPFLALITPIGTVETPPGSGTGIPSHPIHLPGTPTHPIGPISGYPEHPIQPVPPADAGPSHPIILPGTPTHPIVLPPVGNTPPGIPTHPIFRPDLDPSHPIELPPDATLPPGTFIVMVYSAETGWKWTTFKQADLKPPTTPQPKK